MRLQGPQIMHCPLGVADWAGRGTGRPQAADAPISTPSPAGTGTLPASAGVARGQRRNQGPRGWRSLAFPFPVHFPYHSLQLKEQTLRKKKKKINAHTMLSVLIYGQLHGVGGRKT